jgi:hypothetical protein
MDCSLGLVERTGKKDLGECVQLVVASINSEPKQEMK